MYAEEGDYVQSFEEWISMIGDQSNFSHVQYGRKIFPSNTPKEIIYLFCKMFPSFVNQIEAFVVYDEAPQKDFIISGNGLRGHRFFNIRIKNGWQAIFYVKDDNLAILYVSNDDNQTERLKRICESSHKYTDDHILPASGYIEKPIHDFLRYMYAFINSDNAFTVRNFKKYFITDVDFKLDHDQREAIQTIVSKPVCSHIVVGNAGTGKSTVGIVWLESVSESGQKRLYLTMSGPLVEHYSNSHTEQNELRRQMDMPGLPDITYMTIFDFMKGLLLRFFDQDPYLNGYSALDPEESYRLFKEVFRNYITAHSNSSLKKLDPFLCWREIHGLIKGAIVNRKLLGEKNFQLSSPLTLEEYYKVKEIYLSKWSEDSTAGSNISGDILFKLLNAYQKRLEKEKCFDDNDMAILLYRKRELISDTIEIESYDSAFIDECQDLTEIQMLAIFTLLSSCRHRLISSDRCQIVRPTYYYTGYMQQILMSTCKDDYNEVLPPRFLRENYRSSNQIKVLQNSLIKKINEYYKLKERELQSVPMRPDSEFGGTSSIPPIWIYDTEANRKKLSKIIRKLPKGTIVPIYARTKNNTDIDIISCKGINLQAVVLWQVFENMSANASKYDPIVWDSFYVGITRAEKYLIILEPENNKAGEFLASLPEGQISICPDITEALPNSDQTWENYILEQLENINSDDIIDEAYRLFYIENYGYAREIFLQHKKQSTECAAMAELCSVRMEIAEGNYRRALLHCSHLYSYSKQKASREIAHLYDDPRALNDLESLTAGLMLLYDKNYKNGKYCSINSLSEIYGAYKTRTGDESINTVIYKLCQSFPLVNRRVNTWVNKVAQLFNVRAEELKKKMHESGCVS